MKSMFRRTILLLAILLPLQLKAIEGTIAISEVNIRPKSISVRFKGSLVSFDHVYIFDLIRPDTLSDSEWSSLQEELNAMLGKIVKIDIPSKRYGSRGSVLTIFDTQSISIIEVK